MANPSASALLGGAVTKLKAGTNVAAAVGTRVIPEGGTTTAPYIAVDLIGGPSDFALGSNAPVTRRPQIEVSGYGRTKTEAYSVADAVEQDFDGATFAVANWGTPRTTIASGPFSTTESIGGVQLFRVTYRFKALLVGA